MARKKKKIESKQVNAPATSFAYKGEIHVSLQKNKKTYFTKTYKNHGRWPLFYFINMCLAQDYSSAESYRPKFINVFDFSLGDTAYPPTIEDGSDDPNHQIANYFNSANCISMIAYPYNSQPDVKYEPEENGSSIITYKFTVPFTQINFKSDPARIEGFALYASPTDASVNPVELSCISNPCAYFFLTDSISGKIVNLLKDLNTDSLGDEYNLYIEWTLSIVNQATVAS